MRTVPPILMTRDEAIAYINSAATQAERNQRKAQTWHIMYSYSLPMKDLITKLQPRNIKR